MQSLVDLPLRAAYLVGLALAPPLLSPAPVQSAGAPANVIAALLLLAMVFAAGRLRVRLGGREGLAAAVLIGGAVAAALIASDVFRGDRAPLGRGVLYVAPLLWAGLAIVAGVMAARRFGKRMPRARVAGVALVAALGAGLVASAGWAFSPERMWLSAVRVDGDNAVAVEALTGAPLAAKKYDVVLAVLDRCLAENPEACACLARRAEVRLHTAVAEQAIAEARAVRDRCPSSVPARASLAQALALYGDAEQAEQEARASLDKGDDGVLRYALAFALNREGRHAEALEEAKRAVNLGAGRDASLLLGSMAITAGDLDTAAAALGPMVTADPDDADAEYDLALVADRRNDYNRARQGYLAALRASPRHAGARYNLTLLTLRQGAVDEARHDAERFIAAFPGDPRGPALAARVAGGAPR